MPEGLRRLPQVNLRKGETLFHGRTLVLLVPHRKPGIDGIGCGDVT